MSTKIDWVRTVRAVVVAGVLLIALIGAVLASVGTEVPVWLWARKVGAEGAALDSLRGSSVRPSVWAALPHGLEQPA